MTLSRKRIGLLLLMTASGFAGLGFQIVWTQQGALWLGHEAASVLAVVAAFFGGLATGASTLGERSARSARPALWYAACEAVCGAWGIALVMLMAPVAHGLQHLVGLSATPAHQWVVAFAGLYLLLLPSTAAMGATLPSLASAMRAAGAGLQGTVSIAALYGANTLGAVLGVLASSFWFVPHFGLAWTAAVCGALDLLCAAAALTWWRTARGTAMPALDPVATARPDGVVRTDDDGLADRPEAADRIAARAAMTRLFFTGLLGIGFEVVVVRVLSQVCENTVYTFASLLAVYLVGSACGAAAYARFAPRARGPAALTDRLLAASSLACLAGAASLWAAARVHQALASGATGPVAAVAVEAALALAAFGLPTVAMGALFSHLAGIAGDRRLGRALGINTLGAALAPIAFGVVAVTLIGPAASLLGIAGGYIALISWRHWREPKVWGPAFAVVAFAAWAPPLRIVQVPEGGRVIHYSEGATAAVSVVEDADGTKRLRIDNREQEGSSASTFVDGRMALLPLLIHPSPRRALFLGLGTGVTAASATLDPDVEVDVVELVPEVVEASSLFMATLDTKDLHRLHVHTADARRYMREVAGNFDVIVSDNFHPARSGSGALYTQEHFAAVRSRLAVDGLFCQWLPLHQLDLDTTRSIVRAFLSAFPRGQAVLASHSLDTPVIGLIGRAGDAHVDLSHLRARLTAGPLTVDPSAYGIDDELALLGSFVAGAPALARFAAGAQSNTDDRPVVAYRAPLVAYAPGQPPRDRLVALLHQLALDPGDVLVPTTDGTFERRLAAYWAARDRFIDIGHDARPMANPRAMLAQVGGQLLGVVRRSPDFRPAYDPLLRMAVALGQTDPTRAATLLQDLIQAQPARPEAAQALAMLERR